MANKRYTITSKYDAGTDLVKVEVRDNHTNKTSFAHKRLNGRERVNVEGELYDAFGISDDLLAQGIRNAIDSFKDRARLT